jgi:peptidoglycan/LPS O-acetylase OafA/YrhL
VHCTTAGDYNFPTTGSFGVDIFFIISGFIIAYMVLQNTENFLIKRIIRIEPMYILATIAMALTVMIFPDLIRSTTVSFSGFIKSVLFIPGPENRGQPVLGQGWTLNYEMFFYIVMFLCIIFVKNKKYLTLACGFILVFIVVILNFIHSENFILSYYKNNLFLEFIYGMVLYHLYILSEKSEYKIFINKKVKILILTFFAILGYGFMIFSDLNNFLLSSNRNINYGIPVLILVSAILFLEKEIIYNKIVKFGVELGEASYVMYLIHYHIVIFLARAVFNRIIGINNIFILEIVKIVIAFIVTIIFSIIIYRFIDMPIQKYLKKIIRKKQ